MARFNANDFDKYGNSGGGGAGFFKLADDGDVATVRFLYNDADDIEGYAVHEIPSQSGKKMPDLVNCLREYNQPVDDCPFCKANMPVKAKLFIPLYNLDEKKVQIWDRGKTFYSVISKVCARYEKNPIVSQTFDVERVGKAKDTSTTYNIYRTDDPADNTKLEDFEMPKILGVKVLDKSADDMEFYLENKYFPPEDEDMPRHRTARNNEDAEDEMPVRRGSSSRRAGRRTPSDSF